MSPATDSEVPGEGVATRRLALEVLARVEDEGAYANLALGPALERSGLDQRDRALATDLTYGTLRSRRAMEHLVGRFLSDPPPPAAHRSLLLGAYQVTCRPDIPTYAAVSATVGAAPKRYRGLVNAVLRRVAKAPVSYPDDATRLSYPDWIVERLTEDLGEERALAALESMNEPARTHVRADGYVQDLASQGVTDVLVGDLITVARAGAPEVTVVDLCAAPGGKATAIGAAEGVWVAAMDRAPQRADLVASNAARLGSDDVDVLVGDALVPPLRPGRADGVLVDAPCSGLGSLRRRPDARWRIDADAPDRLAGIQEEMLASAAELVAPGGVLAYSVCTLTARETTAVDEHFRAQHAEFVPLDPPPPPWEPWGLGAILLPQSVGTDGMALFRYRRS